jgi:hypothetical protein
MLLWVWTLGLAFGGFTLCPAEGSTYYILLAIFSSILWTLDKIWPLNPTASGIARMRAESGEQRAVSEERRAENSI